MTITLMKTMLTIRRFYLKFKFTLLPSKKNFLSNFFNLERNFKKNLHTTIEETS